MLAAVREQLLPRLSLITPNGPELEALTGLPVSSPELVRLAARRLRELGARAVLVRAAIWAGAAISASTTTRTRPANSGWRRHASIHATVTVPAAATPAPSPPWWRRIIRWKTPSLWRVPTCNRGWRRRREWGWPGPIAHLGWPADLAHFPAPCWRDHRSIAASDCMRQAVPACRMALRADRTQPRPLSSGGFGQVAAPPAGAGVKTIQLRIRICPPLRWHRPFAMR